MRQKIQLLPSGIPLIDKTWGGFYRSGTYLLTGSQKSGKTLLGLQFAQESVRMKEVCLYFTTSRPKDLLINAASINFDLDEYVDNNQVIIVRVNPVNDGEVNDNDEHLSDYLKDIIPLIEQYQPAILIFDELTPLVEFQDLKKLKNIFLQACESIEEAGVTSLFIIGEPATKSARAISDLLSEYSTGIISLQKTDLEGITREGAMIITPNIGHTEGRFKARYYVEPNKGIVTDLLPAEEWKGTVKLTGFKKESSYKSLSEIEIPVENYSYTTFYNLNDFLLILNNQIALYKSTGQVFTVVSFSLDMEAIEQGLLTINQLKNSVRLSSGKKDKICLVKNKVVVLIPREDQKIVNNLIARVKGNFPVSDQDYINKVSRYISVYTIQMNDSINSADDILTELAVNQYQNNN
jgi:KaiC/GvpD/RAD55 family RecA-like ATPase